MVTSEDPEAVILRYEESTLIVLTNFIRTVLSSSLPAISILMLYFVKSTLKWLEIMVVFTTLFSATLTILRRLNMSTFSQQQAEFQHNALLETISARCSNSQA